MLGKRLARAARRDRRRPADVVVRLAGDGVEGACAQGLELHLEIGLSVHQRGERIVDFALDQLGELLVCNGRGRIVDLLLTLLLLRGRGRRCGGSRAPTRGPAVL